MVWYGMYVCMYVGISYISLFKYIHVSWDNMHVYKIFGQPSVEAPDINPGQPVEEEEEEQLNFDEEVLRLITLNGCVWKWWV